jgi:hypothetical protein
MTLGIYLYHQQELGLNLHLIDWAKPHHNPIIFSRKHRLFLSVTELGGVVVQDAGRFIYGYVLVGCKVFETYFEDFFKVLGQNSTKIQKYS